MDDERQVALWPSRENYARFRAVCDDDVPETFDKFEALASERLAILAKEGVDIDKIGFDPDRMALWCRTKFGKVDAATRRLYAASFRFLTRTMLTIVKTLPFFLLTCCLINAVIAVSGSFVLLFHVVP